jgi:hypothetical protein
MKKMTSSLHYINIMMIVSDNHKWSLYYKYAIAVASVISCVMY